MGLLHKHEIFIQEPTSAGRPVLQKRRQTRKFAKDPKDGKRSNEGVQPAVPTGTPTAPLRPGGAMGGPLKAILGSITPYPLSFVRAVASSGADDGVRATTAPQRRRVSESRRLAELRCGGAAALIAARWPKPWSQKVA